MVKVKEKESRVLEIIYRIFGQLKKKWKENRDKSTLPSQQIEFTFILRTVIYNYNMLLFLSKSH